MSSLNFPHDCTEKLLIEALQEGTGYSEKTWKSSRHLLFEGDLGIFPDTLKSIQKTWLEKWNQTLKGDCLQGWIDSVYRQLPSEKLQKWKEFEKDNQLASVPSSERKVKASLAVAHQTAASPEEIQQRLIAVTAEVTGYSPTEIRLEAHLERDLGIDSMKQAQILIHIKKEFPRLFSERVLPSLFQLREFPTLQHWKNEILKSLKQPGSQEKSSLKRGEGKTSLEKSSFQWKATQKKTGLSPLKKNKKFKIPSCHYLLLGDSKHLSSSFIVSLQKKLLAQGALSVRPLFQSCLDATSQPPPLQKDTLVLYLFPQRNTASLLLQTAQRLLKQEDSGLLYWITYTDSRDPISQGFFSGWTRALSQEFPQLKTRLFHLSSSHLALEKILKTLALLSQREALPFFEADWQSSSEAIRTRIPLSLESQERGAQKNSLSIQYQENKIFFPKRPRILISGGLKGIGFQIASFLAQRLPGLELVLIGRTPQSDPELKKNQAILEAQGAQVDPFCWDLSHPHPDFHESKIQQLIQAYPCFFGIIHAAGILEDGPFIHQTMESFDRLYAVKVGGAQSLLKLAQKTQTRFFCGFSSISGTFGNAHQANYAAANAALTEWLNAENQNFNRTGLHCFSVAWGPWKEVGMAARSGVAELLQTALDPDEACLLFWNHLVSLPGPSELVIQRVLSTNHPSQRPKPLEEGLEETLDLSQKKWAPDHVLLGTPLLPASASLDRMAQWGSRFSPPLKLIQLNSFTIHQATLLSDTPTLSALLELPKEKTANSKVKTFQLRLSTTLGTHQKATGKFAFTLPLPPTQKKPLSFEAKETLRFSAIYEGKSPLIPLGPAFQVLKEWSWDQKNQACGKTLPFATHPPQIPNALLEASFQVAALFSCLKNQQGLLPKSFEKWERFQYTVDENLPVEVSAAWNPDKKTFELTLSQKGVLFEKLMGWRGTAFEAHLRG